MARASLAPLPAADEEAVIKARFQHQVTTARGEPPFKRVTKRLIHLCEEAEAGSANIAVAHEAVLREISAMELQVRKQAAILLANERDQAAYQTRQEHLASQIEQAKLDIAGRKSELEEARVIRQHNEEYEVLRNLLVQHPLRAATQGEINGVKAAIDKITEEGKRTARLMQRRRKQFALLFHVMAELQRTLDEPEEEPAGPDGMAVDEALTQAPEAQAPGLGPDSGNVETVGANGMSAGQDPPAKKRRK